VAAGAGGASGTAAGGAASLAGVAGASPVGEVVWAKPAKLQATIPTNVRARIIRFM